MGLNASKVNSSVSKIPPLESGNYPARVLHVIDCGLQPQRPFKGQEKPPAQTILISYEFVDEFLPDDEGQDQEDKPRVLSERFPLRNIEADRAKSTQRYKALDADMKFGGDFTQLVNTPVNVTVVRDEKPDGRVYNNIGGVSPMRPKDAAKCPELVNEALVFDLDNPDIETFKKLHDWIKKVIVSNLEYEGSVLQKLLENDEDYQKADTSGVEVEDEGEGDEENPF